MHNFLFQKGAGKNCLNGNDEYFKVNFFLLYFFFARRPCEMKDEFSSINLFQVFHQYFPQQLLLKNQMKQRRMRL